MSKEAIQKALDHSEPSILSPDWTLVRNEDIAALREALAEQEPTTLFETFDQYGEGWERLAWELCAEEHGEDACSELIWEGGPIPEPWGDRWLKYEDEAKRLIALVHKCTTPQPPAQQEPVTDEENEKFSRDVSNFKGTDEAATMYALEKFLKGRMAPQPAPVQQEPAFYRHEDGHMMTPERAKFLGFDLNDLQALYTSPQPAQRTWVGLTDEECVEIAARGYPRWLEFAHAVEAKLKEKNNG